MWHKQKPKAAKWVVVKTGFIYKEIINLFRMNPSLRKGYVQINIDSVKCILVLSTCPLK